MAETTPARPRTVADLRDHLAAQTDEAAALFRSVDEARLVRRPGPAKWSAVEHLDHLVKVNRAYLAALEHAIQGGIDRGLSGSGPFRGSMVGRFFARSMEPPVKIRVKTLKAMVPDADLAVEPTLALFLDVQDGLRGVLARGDGLDLDAVRMASPFLSLVRAPVFSWFHVVTAHTRRHLWLVRETLALLEAEPG